MEKVNLLVYFIVAIVLGVSCTSCSDSDEQESDVSGIVGTWKMDDNGDYLIYTFNANGTGIGKEIYLDDDYVDDVWNITYTYNEETKVLKICEEDGDIDIYTVVVLNGNKLIIEDEDGYLEEYEKLS